MWLDVDSPQHYFIEDICDYRSFLEAVHLILQPEDFIIFSSYGSRQDIRAFLEQHQLEPDAHVSDERKRLANYPDDYPDAFAVRWVANRALLEQLSQLLKTTEEYTDLCDHIIAYGQRGALLSFHDAFTSDPLIVSSSIPKSQIEWFCELLGVNYKLQDRKAFYG
jgi:hypothetical protein